MAAAALDLNGNAIARANVIDGQPVGQPGMDHAAADRRLERRLHFYAIVYMMLGASFLLSAAVIDPHPHRTRADDTSRRSGAFEAAIGILLWAWALALVLLSFHLHRFPMAALAAARLTQAALRAFF